MPQTLLVELGLEELPPLAVSSMSTAWQQKITKQLENKKAKFVTVQVFAAARRLAIIIDGLEVKQEFIKDIITKSISDLPGKKMRWGEGNYLFARPVHWVLALLDNNIIDLQLFGITASNVTYGHRFLAPNKIIIVNPDEYEHKLEALGKVIVDYNKRQQIIISHINNLAASNNAEAILDHKLLEEVTGMTEYPRALLVDFSADFLKLPKECLITAMAHHQKSFALRDLINKEQLLAKFIIISNMPIDDPNNIIAGNQRVMQARLQDAAFLYEQDLKISLNNRIDNLKNIILQQQLGSIYGEALRINTIAEQIAINLNINLDKADIKQAALLAKADLASCMVQEFPELQGIMGYYYAKAQQEPERIAKAIKEHYLPRFMEDDLPHTDLGICLALAYRLDLLVGLFAIGKAPTGEKDPFALRRHALAIIRILIDKNLSLNLLELFNFSIKAYNNILTIKPDLIQILTNFCQERLKYWYLNNNIDHKIFNAVADKNILNLHDFNLRINAILKFNINGEANSLIAAHKRINNILIKANNMDINNKNKVNQQLLILPEELALFNKLIIITPEIDNLIHKQEYNLVLQQLIILNPLINQFFDKVMIMVEDYKLKNNRLILLLQLKQLLSSVAELSCLV